jgi:hypothetical protein
MPDVARSTKIPAEQIQKGEIPRVSRVSEPARPDAIRPIEDLTSSQGIILRSLMELEALEQPAPSREKLAFWSCVPPTSGGYKNNLGALRSAGLISYLTPGTVAITEDGRNKFGHMDAPEPEEVIQRGLSILTKSQRDLLDELISNYPAEMDRDSLAERAGVPPTSGGYKNNLGALRTAGLIEYPSAGMVKCADWLKAA